MIRESLLEGNTSTSKRFTGTFLLFFTVMAYLYDMTDDLLTEDTSGPAIKTHKRH